MIRDELGVSFFSFFFQFVEHDHIVLGEILQSFRFATEESLLERNSGDVERSTG